MSKLLSVNDFALVVSSKKMKGSGLNNGDVLLISGIRPAPVSVKDPYLQRIYVIALRFINGLLQVPTDENEFKAYMVDPRNLERLPDEEQAVLTDKLRKQYERPKDEATN